MLYHSKRKKIHQSKEQNSKIRKWWKICSKIERLEVYYFPRKEKRKERRRDTFPSTLNFNKLVQFHLAPPRVCSRQTEIS